MGGMCSAQASSAPVYATDEASEPAREIQADQEVGATAAARAGEAASPPPPDNEAGDAAPPAADPDAARVHPSMSSLFDAERGHGAMIAMEGGVLDPATTTGGSAAAAEYAPGDAVVHDGETLFIVEDVLGEGAFGAVYK